MNFVFIVMDTQKGDTLGCQGYWREDISPRIDQLAAEGVRFSNCQATAIATGYSHSCAIQSGSGRVVCWGDDITDQATPPASVDGTAGTMATGIAAGRYHSCAIQAGTAKVVCWGWNNFGQLIYVSFGKMPKWVQPWHSRADYGVIGVNLIFYV